MKRLLLLPFVALATAGPASAGPLTFKDAAAARKVYVGKCAKCHKFYEPKKYNDAEWEGWMSKMSRKSKLKADQEALLREYLAEYRAGKRAKVR